MKELVALFKKDIVPEYDGNITRINDFWEIINNERISLRENYDTGTSTANCWQSTAMGYS